jgi:uncharacterized membrane protein
MNIGRILRHLSLPDWRVRAYFSPDAMREIENVIRAAESAHGGQIRFAVENALDIGPLLRGATARERALQVFSDLRVWDTAGNNGVLIYLLLADHDVEIIADRGINNRVGVHEWERICRLMETHFREGKFEQGVTEGIRAVSTHLASYYPGKGADNELPDSPVVL